MRNEATFLNSLRHRLEPCKDYNVDSEYHPERNRISNQLIAMLRAPNKAFQTDKVAVSHLLQRAQKLRHSNFAAEQRRYASRMPLKFA